MKWCVCAEKSHFMTLYLRSLYAVQLQTSAYKFTITDYGAWISLHWFKLSSIMREIRTNMKRLD